MSHVNKSISIEDFDGYNDWEYHMGMKVQYHEFITHPKQRPLGNTVQWYWCIFNGVDIHFHFKWRGYS